MESRPDVESELKGKKLEKYTLLSKLSKGGMAWVYLAEHTLLKKKVAVKILLPELAKNQAMVERFMREARAAAGLNHPNIIKIYDVGMVQNIHYIAMDYINGPRLTDHMAKKGTLKEYDILRISQQVLEAISEAHDHQIIHRDLKPHNIMLDHRGDVVIMDFGIAKAAYNSDMTATGSFLGTAKYASPEQVRGEKVTPGSDLYSWGIVMYEMATGQAPFTGKDIASLVFQHLNAEPTAPVDLNPDLSPELNRIILKCLEKAPENRYAKASDLLAQINQLAVRFYAANPTKSYATNNLTGDKTKIITNLDKVEVGKKSSKRRLGLWGSVWGLTLLSAMLIGWWSLRRYNFPIKPPISNNLATQASSQQIQTDIPPPPRDTAETAVQVWTERNKYRIGESIKINFRTRKNAYLFLYHEDALGQGQIIFPSNMNQDNFLVGGLTYTIPDPNASFDFIVQPPTGTEHIKALYTTSRDQADRWRKMMGRALLNELKKQKDLLVFEVVD